MAAVRLGNGAGGGQAALAERSTRPSVAAASPPATAMAARVVSIKVMSMTPASTRYCKCQRYNHLT